MVQSLGAGQQKVVNGTPTNYTYNGLGRITSDGTYTFSYDNEGNLTSKTSGEVMSYDWKGNCVFYRDSSGTVTWYGYNIENVRTVVVKDAPTVANPDTIADFANQSQGEFFYYYKELLSGDRLLNVDHCDYSSASTVVPIDRYCLDPGTGIAIFDEVLTAQGSKYCDTYYYLFDRVYSNRGQFDSLENQTQAIEYDSFIVETNRAGFHDIRVGWYAEGEYATGLFATELPLSSKSKKIASATALAAANVAGAGGFVALNGGRNFFEQGDAQTLDKRIQAKLSIGVGRRGYDIRGFLTGGSDYHEDVIYGYCGPEYDIVTVPIPGAAPGTKSGNYLNEWNDWLTEEHLTDEGSRSGAEILMGGDPQSEATGDECVLASSTMLSNYSGYSETNGVASVPITNRITQVHSNPNVTVRDDGTVVMPRTEAGIVEYAEAALGSTNARYQHSGLITMDKRQWR